MARRRWLELGLVSGAALTVIVACVPPTSGGSPTGAPGGGAPGGGTPRPTVAPPPLPGPVGSIPDSQIASYTVPTTRTIPSTPGSGDFRAICQFSHFSNDDPIVYPNQPGAAHLHMFFGNTGANAFSTDQRLLTSGDGTCNGGPLNRSAYWLPALYDSNNNVRIPQYILLYYKTGNLSPSAMQRMPQGFKMITGDVNATAPQDTAWVRWQCGNSEARSATIPVCGAGAELRAFLIFPTCWNGRDLDSPDHRSHVVQGSFTASGYQCPSGYSTPLPEVTFVVRWQNPDMSTSGWYLSSDRHGGVSKPGGSTLHADWWGAWQPTVFQRLIDNCLRGQISCQDGELGDGTQMKSAPVYSGPIAIGPPGPY